YPDHSPKVNFNSRINLPCVDQRTGTVIPEKLSCLARWSRTYSLETILVELRREMANPANRKLPQPAEGTTF
ncbi:E2 ubiquitin-conjugating protein mms2, partial [Nowakowskiella sp. JEL0078]